MQVARKWLENELGLENGIPSHDTFGKVFSMINVQDFSKCFTNWMHDISSLSDGEIVAIDGKTLRGTKTSDKSAIHMVSAWACYNQGLLGQQVVDQKSNEITTVSKLL